MSTTIKVGCRMVPNLPELNDEQLKACQPHDFIPLLLAINKHVAPQALSKGYISTIFNALLTHSKTISPEERNGTFNSWSVSPDWTDIDNILGVTIPHAELLPDRKIKIEGLIFRLPVVSPAQFLNHNYSPDQFLSLFRSWNTEEYGFHILSPEVCQAAMLAFPDYYPQASETAKKQFRDRVNGRKGREALRAYAEDWADRYAVMGPFSPIEGHERTTLLPRLVPEEPVDPVEAEYQKLREEYGEKLGVIEEEQAVCYHVTTILDSRLEEPQNADVAQRLRASMVEGFIASGAMLRTF